MDDEKSVSDQHLFDDDIIYFVLKLSENDENTEPEWEEINVIGFDQESTNNQNSNNNNNNNNENDNSNT